MVTNDSSALQTPAIYLQSTIHPWTEFAALVLSGIVFILVLKKIFKWESFSLLFKNLPVIISPQPLLKADQPHKS
jgi:hypothetical protein